MLDLSFQIIGAEADVKSASPLLLLKLAIGNATDESIQSIALRCQVQIEATRRRYSPAEQARLIDLFGEPDRWSRTLGGLLWTHAGTVVPSFDGQTVVDLPLPCTFDFNVAATKYFHGLEEGEIPLALQFSGTIFYRAAAGNLQVAQISWDKEARYRLPVRVWREMMDRHYPNGAWLRLRRDVFDRLHEFKTRHAIPTWEAAVERLLAESQEQVPS
jgi:hypothetical protein